MEIIKMVKVKSTVSGEAAVLANRNVGVVLETSDSYQVYNEFPSPNEQRFYWVKKSDCEEA